MARAKGFNRKNVTDFFNIYERIVDENQFDAARIYNLDESGFSTIQKKPQKILARKGKKQVGVISSGERGVNTTIVCCFNGTGVYVPPMFIFKRMRMHESLKNGAPPGSLVEVSESGYINSNLFTKYLQHFVKTIKPTKDQKVLLLLDGHATHTKNLDALELARDHGIILLQLPAHVTHNMQPLDVGFFSPLEKRYVINQETWLRSNPRCVITQFQITALLGEAYCEAATVANAIGGFKGSGIWPVSRHVFSDVYFAAADILNESENENDTVTRNVTPIAEIGGTENVRETTVSQDFTIDEHSNPNNKTEKQLITEVENNTKLETEELRLDDETATLHYYTPLEISPMPKIIKQTTKRKRKTQKTTLLTTTPYKEQLEQKKKQKTKSKFVDELKEPKAGPSGLRKDTIPNTKQDCSARKQCWKT
ncbi:hypothetical protein Zmor_006133 [Zophobas morio]|uniref:DDE-1 domain-containing protein n=1 Tax=Zophobas morio TaxID=2755281 RepID=A0AA38MNA3_9CUCU|nr:hypothetical protein Zmor_006133 [Zophobas morio]